MRLRSALLLFVSLVLSFPLLAADPSQIASDYHRLQAWQFSTPALTITQPITIKRDTATFTLTSGGLRLMEPTSTGHVTGLVFGGQGHFTMTIPDSIEVAQLRRFSGKDITSLDQPFRELVLRISDDTLDKLFPGASKPPFEKNDVAEKRQNHWLIDLRHDVDAGIIAAMVNPGALQITAAIKTADFDWLTYDYDSTRREEIQIIRWIGRYPEVWVSLDRAEERDASGRPGANDVRPATLDNLDIDADLSHSKWNPERVGETQQLMLNGHYIIREDLTPQIDGVVALPLELEDMAQNLVAFDEKGHPLVVLRDHIGTRSSAIDNRIYDSRMTVLFPAPLKAGQPIEIEFRYDLELPNYAPGNSWYPTVPEAFDRSTAKLTLKVAKRNEVRSMGRLDSEKEVDGAKISVWVVEKPTMMITFSTAEHFDEAKLDVAGIPQVISFGTVSGLDSGTRIRNAGADVANSLQFYQAIFDDKLDVPKMYVTSIAAGHGQAFEGFLHLSEFAYEEHPGATELFRAHEVAHEWWGHKVGWKTYRDQWLSESLAEYSSMMFVQSTVKGGDKFYNEIINVYDSIVQGSLSGGFSKFNRPWLIELRSAARARIGPIGVGYRAGTGDVPFGYEIQAYYKGPLVLHMLRTLMSMKTHNDDLFIKILRDFIKEYSGSAASTADFEKVIERDAPGDWSYFFNAWIYDSGIPTYRWSYKVEKAEQGAKLTVTVKRSGVRDDFTVIAPVRVEFEGGRSGMFYINVKSNEQTVTQNLPAAPKNVIFAPDHSLLANIRRE